jgi:hypothetical protein
MQILKLPYKNTFTIHWIAPIRMEVLRHAQVLSGGAQRCILREESASGMFSA